MQQKPIHDISAQITHARDLWLRDRPDAAEAILRTLALRLPDSPDIGFLRAEIARSGGALTTASKLVFELCCANGFESAVSLRGARFIQECQRHALAIRLMDELIARDGANAEALALAGTLAREAGDFERARTFYREAIAAGINLDHSFLLGALAQITRYADEQHPDFVMFSRHFHDARYSPRSRASAGFGLGKARADVGDTEAATLAWREANATVKATGPWDSFAWHSFVEARRTQKLAQPSAVTSSEFIPVFVVGLPRSGTTLTASRLANLAGMRDRGELRILRFVADKLIQGEYLDNVAAVREAAQLYRAHAVQDDAPVRWYIDQDPLNFRYLDIAAAMFPQARIIHCRRSPRDTALSLWAQDFAHPDAGFAYDFSDIADYAEGHDALMAQWHKTLRVPIHELDYETLVSDTDKTLRELAAFVGAPFAPQPQVDVPINSSSVWQARQPIYATSLGRWRAYLPWIPELARFAE